MSTLKCFVVLISIISVTCVEHRYAFKTICKNFAGYFNFVNKMTPLGLTVNFYREIPILSDSAKIEFSSDVAVLDCTSLITRGKTFVLSAKITGDLIIHTKSKKNVILENCDIVANMLLEKGSGQVSLKTQSIQITDHGKAYFEDKSAVGGWISPLLSKALSDSVLGKDMQFGLAVDTAPAKEAVYFTIKYFLFRIKI